MIWPSTNKPKGNIYSLKITKKNIAEDAAFVDISSLICFTYLK
jgi:hypothetical protein